MVLDLACELVILGATKRQQRVGFCLMQCNMEKSAIWEMIPITQEADVLVEESFGRTRPTRDIHRLC